MTLAPRLRRRAAAPLLAAAALTAALAAQPAAAAAAATPAAPKAKPPSCTRGGAKFEQRSGGVAILRQRAKPRRQQTRRENVLACWRETGRRTTLAVEVDPGADNRASTAYEIVQGRYAGVIATNEGGVSISVSARVYDVRSGRLLHDSKACEALDRGDLTGPDDVAFLDGGGLALACGQLILYRKAGSAAEQLEPVGTFVRQLAVSRYSTGFVPRLYWTVTDGQTDTTKSLELR